MQRKTSPERLAYLAQYREKNRERLREYQRNWALENRVAEREKSARYLAKNKEWNAEKSQKRRAKLRDVGVFLVTNFEMKKLYESECIACGSAENITIDHIIPISRGGRHSIGNLQSLCLSCNSSKHNKTMTEWMQSKKMLGVG